MSCNDTDKKLQIICLFIRFRAPHCLISRLPYFISMGICHKFPALKYPTQKHFTQKLWKKNDVIITKSCPFFLLAICQNFLSDIVH